MRMSKRSTNRNHHKTADRDPSPHNRCGNTRRILPPHNRGRRGNRPCRPPLGLLGRTGNLHPRQGRRNQNWIPPDPGWEYRSLRRTGDLGRTCFPLCRDIQELQWHTPPWRILQRDQGVGCTRPKVEERIGDACQVYAKSSPILRFFWRVGT